MAVYETLIRSINIRDVSSEYILNETTRGTYNVRSPFSVSLLYQNRILPKFNTKGFSSMKASLSNYIIICISIVPHAFCMLSNRSLNISNLLQVNIYAVQQDTQSVFNE